MLPIIGFSIIAFRQPNEGVGVVALIGEGKRLVSLFFTKSDTVDHVQSVYIWICSEKNPTEEEAHQKLPCLDGTHLHIAFPLQYIESFLSIHALAE